MIAKRWPIFHDRSIMQTPVRGIVAVPLRDGLQRDRCARSVLPPPADVAAINPTDVDALAILRAHAFAADRTADDAAHDIVDGSLSPHLLTQDSNS